MVAARTNDERLAQAERFYYEHLKAVLEPHHHREFVAIDVTT